MARQKPLGPLAQKVRRQWLAHWRGQYAQHVMDYMRANDEALGNVYCGANWLSSFAHGVEAWRLRRFAAVFDPLVRELVRVHRWDKEGSLEEFLAKTRKK